MPGDMSDSEYALILAGRRRGLPLLANAGAEVATELRHGVPLRRIAHQVASGIKALHALSADGRHFGPELRAAFRRMLLAYLGLFNMLSAAADPSLPQRLLSGNREELDCWLRAVALEGDVLGTAGLDRQP